MTKAPNGANILIPENVDPANDPYPTFSDKGGIYNSYENEGYVVVRNLIPTSLCDEARKAYLTEVKPFHGHIYRQTTANPERPIVSNIESLNGFIEDRYHGFLVDFSDPERAT